MIKSALVLKGQGRVPDGDKARRYGIRRLYYEAIDTEMSARYLAEVRSWGFLPGVMWDPSWTNYSDSPEVWIQKLNKQYEVLAPRGPDGRRPGVSVMLDIERHDPNYVYRALTEFRRTRPGCNVVWTVEYHQAGWFTDELVSLINDYRQLVVVPQCYYGDMVNYISDAAALRDQTNRGVSNQRVAFFYSTRVPVPYSWDGVLYLENWALLP